jgi:hypothetical protein
MLYARLPIYLDIEGKHKHNIDTETYTHYTDVRLYPEDEAQDHNNTLEAKVMFIIRDQLGNIYKPKETTPIFELNLGNSLKNDKSFKDKSFKNSYLNIIGNIMIFITAKGLFTDILETMPTPLGIMQINNKLVYTFELYMSGDNIPYIKDKFNMETVTSRDQLEIIFEEEELFFKPVIFLDELEKGE